MNFHKTCRTLPIYNFNEILLTKDLRFLIKEFDEYEQEDLLLSKEDLNEANEIYKLIIYEYSELTANNSIISKYKSEFLIDTFEFRYNQALNILKLYSKYEDLDLLKILNKLGFPFSEELDVNDQIEKITKSLRGFKTKIDVLKVKHNAKFEKSNNEKENETNHNNRLDEEALALELSLNLGYSLNLKKISTSKWVTMWNLSNKRNSKINGKS